MREFRSTRAMCCGNPRRMAKITDETHQLSWPWWAPWALVAVAATSLLTVAATLYDIL